MCFSAVVSDISRPPLSIQVYKNKISLLPSVFFFIISEIIILIVHLQYPGFKIVLSPQIPQRKSQFVLKPQTLVDAHTN